MQIDFLQTLRAIASCYGVNMTVFRREMEDIPEFDMGLRRSLGMSYDIKLLFEWYDQNVRQGVLTFVQDFTNSEYCYIPVPDSEKEACGDFILIGPYLESSLSYEDIEQIQAQGEIPEQFSLHLKEYLHAVPVINGCDRWREVCKQLMVMLCQIPVEVEHLMQEGLSIPADSTPVYEFLSADLIEQRYRAEAFFCKMVESGQTEEALSAMLNLFHFRLQPRYREPVSQTRSALIMMNTMLRREMVKAEIHPYYIDQLSSQLGRKIDMVFTDKDAANLRTEMVRKYCMLVKNYSLKGHSEVIQKIVNHIRLNLTADLSLKIFAEMYSINASYLSSLFKKEMGVTITEYVNQQRIQHSLSLLNSSEKQIQDIAAECGIYDVNYYRRLFKRMIGLSPSDYMKQIHQKGVK